MRLYIYSWYLRLGASDFNISSQINSVIDYESLHLKINLIMIDRDLEKIEVNNNNYQTVCNDIMKLIYLNKKNRN